jgi:hypothetical protein
MAAKKEKQTTYCDKRLSTYLITDEFNNTKFIRKVFKSREGTATVYEDKLEDTAWFTATDQNDIRILYKTLDNQQLHVHGESKNVKPFYRICLNDNHRDYQKVVNGVDKKYHQDAGTGTNLFLTQYVIDCFSANQPLETLYLIEGEFKAFSLWMNAKILDIDLAVIGLPGIQMFTDGKKIAPMFHEDIDQVIKLCGIKNIVMVHDADALQMGKWDHEKQPDKDLSIRLNSFYSTVNNIREITKLYDGLEFYYMHIKEMFMEERCIPADTTCKGLDDLILARPPVIQDIIKDLQRHSRARIYFDGFNASEKQPNWIQSYFLLNKKSKAPLDFYLKFQDIIKDHIFNFKGWRYQYVLNEQEGNSTLRTVQHMESNKFIRVGTDYFKIAYKPNSKDIEERSLIKWSQTLIKLDYIDKGYPHFLDEVKKYTAFCNVPEHNPDKFQLDYKNSYNDLFYNLYYPLNHILSKGEWPTIKKYLFHIFQDRYDFGLDYMYLSYMQPLQRLPIICLVSKEHNTGKSTFLWFLRAVFAQNATIIGNQELHDNFNDDYVSKKFICIDEGLIEKITVLEKIKSWNTSHKIKMNTKNVARTEIDFFANIVLTSNHEDNFIKIDPNADRFFVQKVPALKERDPDILDKMEAEIPHFLYYLVNEHKLKHEKKERFYFSAEDYSTDALKAVQRQSKSWLHKTIEIMIEEMFRELNCTEAKVLTLFFTESELFKEISARYKKNVEVAYLRGVLKDEMKLNNQNLRSAMQYQFMEGVGTAPYISEQKKPKGRYYIFNINNFFLAEDLNDFGITEKDIFIHTENMQRTEDKVIEELPF